MSHPPSPTGLAIVTGTSAGIGQHVATLLLERGWEVVGLARRSSPVAHQHYHHLATDLRDPAALDALIAERIEPLLRDPRWGRMASSTTPPLPTNSDRCSGPRLRPSAGPWR